MKKRNGFSLTEVLIAASIFMVGMLGLIGMQYTSIYLTRTANNRFIATHLVEQVMENARSSGINQFNPSTFSGQVNEIGEPASTESRTFTRVVTVSGNTLKVQVSWNEKGELKHVTSASFIY